MPSYEEALRDKTTTSTTEGNAATVNNVLTSNGVVRTADTALTSNADAPRNDYRSQSHPGSSEVNAGGSMHNRPETLNTNPPANGRGEQVAEPHLQRMHNRNGISSNYPLTSYSTAENNLDLEVTPTSENSNTITETNSFLLPSQVK